MPLTLRFALGLSVLWFALLLPAASSQSAAQTSTAQTSTAQTSTAQTSTTAPNQEAAQPAIEAQKATLQVAMRDGVRLSTDLYLPTPGPETGNGPWPTIVKRTPYNKNKTTDARLYTQAGYGLVIQDQRGRFESEGVYTPHENEKNDGYDTIEWIANQSWSNGKVGISGASALGIAANMAAAADPPHLEAAYVVVAPESLFAEGRFIGGVFKEADTGNWMRGQGVSEEAVNAYKKRVVLDDRWKEMDFLFNRHTVDIPILNVGGWYDLFLKGTLNNFRYLQEWGLPGAQGRQKVVVGPIGHGAIRGDLAYPLAERTRSLDTELRWFDYWLKGKENGIDNEPPVSYYMRAAARKGDASAKNRWMTSTAWPPPESSSKRLFLKGKLELGFNPPESKDMGSPRSSTAYLHNPEDPIPTVGGLNLTLPLGPMDQRAIPERNDYLRFQTPVLQEDLVLAGQLKADLWIKSDAPDTDFMVKLVDVYPDGYEALILDGALRTRYREGRREQDVRFLESGEPTLAKIDLWHTAITVEKGHRLAVHISSSNYPRFEINPGTAKPPGEDSELKSARNQILHSREYPSAIILPVLELDD